MKEFVEAIPVVDPWHIELSPKAISGQICIEKLKNMSRSATNANGLRRTYTSQRELLIHYPARGYLLNGA